ncbi:MAG TPA: biotin transporter BioY [Leptolyngbyaceae cyanobacterium M33_DOE_097]|uniref:Biotin transporter n=1 Tax=Oscillatoriales cyanobacterium SpSt-418 TaxID=2282169 RepID=A0A7C3PJK8_9CYAN|nr:biotin transporter BioY [Leptolyngbyaceae cyanobacterium M33_DOE_097]
MSLINELLWATFGLFLTIGGTFLGAVLALPSFDAGSFSLQIHSLNVSYQIGAVLLVGCLGGRNAGALSQIAYILLGLTGLDIFNQGGGLDYIHKPSFGYLLGFIPAAWVCGQLAFDRLPRIESLAFSCLCGLGLIHLTGLGYLFISYLSGWLENPSNLSLWDMITRFSFVQIPGQLAVVCAVTVVAFTLRQMMFY